MIPSMRLKFFAVVALSLLMTYLPAQVKIGDNPGLINSSAALELEKTNMGLLITRVALTGATDNVTVPVPANSLLIYNTANAGTGGNIVSPGFYYWDNTAARWKGLLTSSGPAGDVWIDGNNNILSANSANQALEGVHNVVIGQEAFDDLNGISNKVIAIGDGAAQNDLTFGDASIIAIGFQPAMNNMGVNIIAMGENAGLNNQGNNVNAFGFMAAQNNLVDAEEPAGSVNALGEFAAASNTGSLVNALGGAAGENNSGWSANFLGSQAGQFNQGSEVNAMGAMAAQYNTESSLNAFGLEAARYNTGYNTNALGLWAAKYNDGAHAIAIGDHALIGSEWDIEGEGNIGIGYHAGINVSSGMHNICLGYDTPIPNPFGTNQINIGNSIIREENAMIRLKDFIRFTPLDEPPAGAEEGSVYYDSALQKLRVLTESGWVNLN